jgi:hypothetical protein
VRRRGITLVSYKSLTNDLDTVTRDVTGRLLCEQLQFTQQTA